MASTYEPIATTTLGSGTNTVTFSSIPQTYTDLIAVIVGDAFGLQMYMNFNNDFGTNYSYTYMYGDGSYPYTSLASSQTNYRLTGPGGVINSSYIINIFSYTGSTYKTVLEKGSQTSSGAGGNGPLAEVGLWRSTSAINRIDFTNASSNNFNTGTTITLYGIKAA